MSNLEEVGINQSEDSRLCQIETSGFNLDVISLNKLYTLASAPDEVKEDIAITHHYRF